MLPIERVPAALHDMLHAARRIVHYAAGLDQSTYINTETTRRYAVIALVAWALGLTCLPCVTQAKMAGLGIRSDASMAVVDGRPVIVFEPWGDVFPDLAYQLVVALPKVYPPASDQDWNLSLIKPKFTVPYTDEGSTYNWLTITEVNGAPASLVKQYPGAALACARIGVPNQPEDWSLVRRAFGKDWEAERLTITTLGGKPFLACLGYPASKGASGPYGIRIAWPAKPIPESADDMQFADVIAISRQAFLSSGFGLSLAVMDGLPVIAYSAPGATIALPASREKLADPWGQIPLRTTSSFNVGLCRCGDSLYLLCFELPGDLLLGQCEFSKIRQPGSWRWSPVTSSAGSYSFHIKAYGDRLGVAYQRADELTGEWDMCFALAKVDHPSKPTDWLTSVVGQQLGCCALAEVDGRPAVCAFSPYALCYAYATRPDPRSGKDWQVTTVYEDQAFKAKKLAFDKQWQPYGKLDAVRTFFSNPKLLGLGITAVCIVAFAALSIVRARQQH